MLKKFEIELDVPEDVVGIEFRWPTKGEEFMNWAGITEIALHDSDMKRIVIAREKKWRPVEFSDLARLPIRARFRDKPSGDWGGLKLFGLLNFGQGVLYVSETHRWNYCEVEDS